MSQYLEKEASPLITEAAKLKAINIFVNGQEIRSQDMLDLQITFSDYKRGIISFTDTMNLTETAPLTMTYLDISYTDSMGGTYSETFIATSVKSDRNKDATITNLIHFEDMITNTLRLSYISKGYRDKTMLEIIEDIYETLNLPATFTATGNERRYEHFVLPSNISTLEFIEKQLGNSNIMQIADRSGISFITRDLLDFSKLDEPKEFTFTLDNSYEKPYWNILEYNGDILGTQILQEIPDTISYRVSDTDLRLNVDTTTLASIYTKEKINLGFGIEDSTLPEMIYTIGTKNVSTISINDREGITRDLREVAKNAQRIDIVVQGLINHRMYNKIKIELPRPRGVGGGSDIVHSGFFVVTEVTDKILMGNLVQYLTIQRCDYGQGV